MHKKKKKKKVTHRIMKGGQSSHHPAGHRTFFRTHEEKDLSSAAKDIKAMADVLLEDGAVSLSSTEGSTSQVEPASDVELIVKYERLAHGALSLKIELEWYDDASSEDQTGGSGLGISRVNR